MFVGDFFKKNYIEESRCSLWYFVLEINKESDVYCHILFAQQKICKNETIFLCIHGKQWKMVVQFGCAVFKMSYAGIITLQKYMIESLSFNPLPT